MSEADWEAAVALLAPRAPQAPPTAADPAGTVVVACHVNPDGDALGSALGLALALRDLGVDVGVGFGTSDGAGVPASLSFLPGQDLLVGPEELLAGPAPAVLVTTDTGSQDRLGPLAPLADRAGDVLVIDHHASNTRFGSHLLLDTAAASTTVLVEELVGRLGGELTRDIATCLYVGLVTDTGQFQFAATTPAVHALAARLLTAGVRPEEVGQHLFGTAPFAAVRLQGVAVARAVLEPGLVWTWVTQAEREQAGVPLASVEGVIDAIRIAGEAEVALVAKEVDVDTWALSTRSRGTVDVGAICVALGGGGHRFAAGVTLHGSLGDVVDAVRDALERGPQTGP